MVVGFDPEAAFADTGFLLPALGARFASPAFAPGFLFAPGLPLPLLAPSRLLFGFAGRPWLLPEVKVLPKISPRLIQTLTPIIP